MVKRKTGEQIIKSKERVKKYAEVFTPDWLVKKMCYLCESEEENAFTVLTKTFLEPACGTGNFLVEILRRKLQVAETPLDGIAAVSSIFGIDIQQDNVEESKERMKKMFQEKFGENDLLDDVLNSHIVCGNFLTGLTSSGEKIWFLEEEKEVTAL